MTSDDDPPDRRRLDNVKEKDEDEDEEDYDLGTEAAGVVRGVSRSIVRAPLIGRLPRQVVRQRLPVKQVARVSDRLATGLDWWSTAVESSSSSSSSSKGRKSQWWARFRSFAGSMVKNTLLGMAVFESYGYVVGYLAPDEISNDMDDEVVIDRSFYDDDDDDDDESESHLIYDDPDEYARASLLAHFGAGFVAGSIHGSATSILEDYRPYHSSSSSRRRRQDWFKRATFSTLHHSLAHSLLFGSYEFLKRSIVQELHSYDESTRYLGGAYLAGFGIAGGLAGQFQHLFSHYTEQILEMNTNNSTSFRISNMKGVAAVFAPPELRPLLWSFPPSAIGFIAFEYGKKLTAPSSS
eukprot:scaffold3086_cov75-Cylindrotheca_fusiformis.AAC.4